MDAGRGAGASRGASGRGGQGTRHELAHDMAWHFRVAGHTAMLAAMDTPVYYEANTCRALLRVFARGCGAGVEGVRGKRAL